MNDLKLIKKYYGEAMSHLCRELFPTMLEQDGLLFNLIDKHFSHNHFLYNDLVCQNKIYEFKSYIYDLLDVNLENNISSKTPQELLDEAGYDLYECKSEEDIQKFKKFYVKNEELCTFRGGRLDSCYVFFAIKKNVSEIKRLKNPERQDAYGTSVISIQFSKIGNFLSIKNRYNHTVANPDATFSNNLENIIPGLTDAFEKTYNLRINSNKNKFELQGYIYAGDKKYYKYNYEVNNYYFCINNLIINNGQVIKTFQDKARYIFIDYFIIDIKDKKIFSISDLNDGFLKIYNKFLGIDVEKNINRKVLHIKLSKKRNLVLGIDNAGNLMSIEDDKLEKIPDNFLLYDKSLKSLVAPNLRKINHRCLLCNEALNHLYMPKVEKIGDDFLRQNKELEIGYFPKLISVGREFLLYNEKLNFFMAPNLKEVGAGFLCYNLELEYLCLDSLSVIGSLFLRCNNKMEIFIAPKLHVIRQDCLSRNTNLKYIELCKDYIENSKIYNIYILNSLDLLYSHKNRNEIIAQIKENGVWDKDGYAKVLKDL